MNTLNIDAIIDVIKSVTGESTKALGLHEPEISGNEWKYVKDCLDTGWVSSVGQYVVDFENKLKEITGVKHAIATVNGTAALHSCLLGLDISLGDEVLVPALTFVATANAVSYCGAVPHFIDSTFENLGVDSAKLDRYLSETTEIKDHQCWNKKTGRPIKALIVLHAFGHAAELDSLMKVCDKYQVTLIEDAAESLGTHYREKHTGNFGKVAALSFNGNKTVTTGGGGAILTNDDDLAQAIRHLTTTAKRSHQWEFYHDRVGYNYRLPNINAALGLAQLEQLPKFIQEKRKLAERYHEGFKNVEGVEFFKEPKNSTSNYWLNLIVLNEGLEEQRDALLQACHQQRILARPAWTPMHQLPMYQDCPKMDLATAEALVRRIVCIPSSAKLA